MKNKANNFEYEKLFLSPRSAFKMIVYGSVHVFVLRINIICNDLLLSLV